MYAREEVEQFGAFRSRARDPKSDNLGPISNTSYTENTSLYPLFAALYHSLDVLHTCTPAIGRDYSFPFDVYAHACSGGASSSSTNISRYRSSIVSIACGSYPGQLRLNDKTGWIMGLTLHWKDICSKFIPPISGGAPSSVGPKTILRFEDDIWLTDSCRRIL